MGRDLLRYDKMVEDALRGVVRQSLAQVAKNGFPGNHHFYLTFRTREPGVAIPEHLSAQYPEEMTIVLQVGMELRITNKGEVIVSNPELELAREDGAADAVLLYRFNPTAGEHSFRLLDPVADHKHIKVHRRDD